MKKLTRLTFNSSGWQRPTRRTQNAEATGTYVNRYGFGHEDWLFRFDWVIDGWKYGFIQGVNKAGKKYVKVPLDLTLFTKEPGGTRRLVCNLNSVECLDDDQSEEARSIFIENGWLEVMRNEVAEIGGNPDGLEDRKAA